MELMGNEMGKPSGGDVRFRFMVDTAAPVRR